MGYSKHAFKGSSLNVVMKILTVGVTAVKIYILARLLTPYDFGLAQYVIIMEGLLEALTETGINTTIVQSKNSLSYYVNTAWVIAIIRGLVISILMILSGFGMQQFFHEERLLMLFAVASFIPLIKGFINPAIVSLYKNLQFIHDSVYHLSLTAVEALAAIILAFLFHSVFVLVFSMMISGIFEVCISFIFFTIRPQFVFIRSRAREIFLNARGLNINSILSYLVENTDNLLVGKVLGTTELGLYSNGYSLTHKFTLEFAKSVQYGTFPIYVKISEERRRLRRAFWRTAAVSLGGFLVIATPFFLFPRFIVLFFLGQQWVGIIPIVRPLILASLVQSFNALATAVFTASKHYHWSNLSLFVNCASLIVLVILLSQHYGLVGAATGVLIARLLVIPILFFGLRRVFVEK